MAHEELTKKKESPDLDAERDRILRDLGIAIYRLRKDAKMTQTDLCRKAGINVNTLSSYENGTGSPSIQVLVMIASALGCELGVKLGKGKGEP